MLIMTECVGRIIERIDSSTLCCYPEESFRIREEIADAAHVILMKCQSESLRIQGSDSIVLEAHINPARPSSHDHGSGLGYAQGGEIDLDLLSGLHVQGYEMVCAGKIEDTILLFECYDVRIT